ncbi:hypothetical protein HYE67_010147 [Fusarium culmorum]|uniref:Uncharacterized protein n=1 Tax=Fusarium culmorum TaxID=5516 RepID=A0A7S8HZY4_FUSCU|nr:hypothetical protein HYE67_010147 [Fusarium culmorum]
MARVRRRGATAATAATAKRSNHPKTRQKKLPKSQATTPSRTLSDMLLSIKPHHLANIISREKNHEYRNRRLKDGVSRLWLYETGTGGGSLSITHIAIIPPNTRHEPGPQYVKSDLWEDRWGEDRSGKVNKLY